MPSLIHLGRLVGGVMMIAGVLVVSSAATADEAPSLDVSPATIEGRLVSAAVPIRVTVRLKAGAQDLADIALTSFSNDGVNATLEDGSATVLRLAANGEQAWVLRLAPARSDVLPPGNYRVDLAIAFRQGESLTRHYLFQSVKITPPPLGQAAALDVHPMNIDGRAVSSAEPIRVQALLKAGSHDLTEVALSAFSNDGVTTRIAGDAPADIARIPANSEQAWTLLLAPPNGTKALGLVARTVDVRVAFREGPDPARRRYLFQTVRIVPPAAAALPALADIDLEGSLEPLSHERPGRLFLIVTNKYSQPLAITDARITGPRFVDFRGPGAKEFKDPAFARVPYGHAKVLAYDVAATDQVVPGKYSLVAEVSVTALDGLSGSVDKTTQIELAVLGESDMLSKLGAPSLLVLPGVLFLLAWQFLWSIGKNPEQRHAYEMTIASGGFWVVAIVISLLFAYAYPSLILVTLHQYRDYLSGYGLKDFLYIFSLALISACVFFLLWRLLQSLAALHRAWLKRRTTPSENDEPLDLLKKLGRLRQTIRLGRAHAAGGIAADQVLVLLPWCEPAFLWVAPPAQLATNHLANAGFLNFVQQIQNGQIIDARQIARRLSRGRSLEWQPVVWCLRRPRRRYWSTMWILAWRQVGGVDHPRKGALANWTDDAAEGRLIEVA